MCDQPADIMIVRLGDIFKMLVLCIFFFGWKICIHASDTITLQSIPMVGAPVIKDKTLKYTVDFLFDNCPQEVWPFYNHNEERLIIEFVGVHVFLRPVEIRGTSIVSDLKAINKSNDFSLDSCSAQLSMSMKEGWHYTARVVDEKVLQLQLWLPLNPKKNLSKRSRSYLIPVGLSLLVLLLPTLIIIAVQESKR